MTTQDERRNQPLEHRHPWNAYSDAEIAAKKAIMVAQYARTKSVSAACAEAGVSDTHYSLWRKKDPQFDADMQMALHRAKASAREALVQAAERGDIRAIIKREDGFNPEDYTKDVRHQFAMHEYQTAIPAPLLPHQLAPPLPEQEIVTAVVRELEDA